MKPKTVTILNWVFSVFCILSFPAFFPSVASFILLLVGIASLPVNQIQELYPKTMRRSLKTAALGALFFIAVIMAPAKEVPLHSALEESAAPSGSVSVEVQQTVSSLPQSSSSEVALSSVSAQTIPENSTFRVTFIDVGQADSALIECDGHYMLIDGGNVADSNKIYSILSKNNISYLDYVIGTHGHEDHIGGLSGALSYAKAGTVFCPVKAYDSKAFKNFSAKADENGGIIVPSVGEVFSLGSASIEILGLNASEDTNDTSIILKITYGNTSFLFTGDAERAAEQAVIGKDLSADVLKVGHHGSETSTSYVFLREIMPKYAVISVGKDNSYGHPDDAVMSRFRDADVKVFRTDVQGDIVCVSDGETVAVTTSRNQSVDTSETKQSAISQVQTENAVEQPKQQQTEVQPEAVAPQPEPQGNGVWISRSGKKYHSNSGCSGMKSPQQVSLQDAQAMGRGPCKKCY